MSDLLSTVVTLAGALVFGIKHALDADHLAAISTIASERRSVAGSSMIGALWGLGHTAALLIAGIAVIFCHVEIGERVALGLEFGVALMLIGLGAHALRTLAHGGHVHVHAHGDRAHVHVHPHTHAPHATHDHHTIGVRPLLIGMVHGLAGSAALMLLVLSTIPSPVVGLLYVAVFGIGSIGGMVGMSVLVSLPARLSAVGFTRTHLAVQALAALFSLGMGLFMAYEIGFARGFLA
ncbi:MAG TPA: urease accessory protein UreH [Candidatus Binatia bacterium]|nr:urease accessory protein UreH [Candidatus Binatia bacterium]